LWVLVTYNKTAATTALSSDWDGTLWSDAEKRGKGGCPACEGKKTPLSDLRGTQFFATFCERRVAVAD
jgi:hypothetical protein